jgi:hypothetical protein
MPNPCKPEQERNPATNRCRKTCKKGTMRNVQGRCVKSKSQKEKGPKETEPKETGPKETGPKETGPKETGPKETEPKDEKNQTKLSDYYKISRTRRTYKRKPPPKPTIQQKLESYFNV